MVDMLAVDVSIKTLPREAVFYNYLDLKYFRCMERVKGIEPSSRFTVFKTLTRRYLRV
jgi:hypothetical protein